MLQMNSYLHERWKTPKSMTQCLRKKTKQVFSTLHRGHTVRLRIEKTLKKILKDYLRCSYTSQLFETPQKAVPKIRSMWLLTLSAAA